MARTFPASDGFIAWAQSLSGMLTTIRAEYGSASEMVEHSTWDDGKTHYALSLVKSLHEHLSRIDEELTEHVQDKYGQNG